ncbi:hypothetical protein K7X08_004419 [Anisodus acutangulus]|uniref:Uncharacterized protein n=1 Tax=Anisodus acutangulus TaxID=402998 RepID=A0A9Q1MKD9_9SOLA|nr:hypothetical protein K7X08_004419 [Anisodus acutangulus]
MCLLEEENQQMVERASAFDMSQPRVMEDLLLENQLKERFYAWLVHQVTGNGKRQTVLDDKGQGVLHVAAALGYGWALKPILVSGIHLLNFHWVELLQILHLPSGFLAESSLTTHLSTLTVADVNEHNASEVSGAKVIDTASESVAVPTTGHDVPDVLSLKDSLAAYGMILKQLLVYIKFSGFNHFKGNKSLSTALVRGQQVRKKYKPIIWSVGILEKVILRWRRKGSGLRGFRSEEVMNIPSSLDQPLLEDDYAFLKEGRKQTEVRMQKALARVKSMAQYPEARAQYRRLLTTAEGLREAKPDGSTGILKSSEDTSCHEEDLFDVEDLLDDDTFMSIAFE